MDKKIKTYLIVGVIILAFLIGFGWYFYAKGKRKTVIAPVIPDNPSSTDASNNPAGISTTDVKTLADKLYNEIKGWHPMGHDSEPYQDLAALSDTDFEKVYNQFNSDYQSELGNETLASAVNATWDVYDPAFDSIKQSITERFAKLNLV